MNTTYVTEVPYRSRNAGTEDTTTTPLHHDPSVPIKKILFRCVMVEVKLKAQGR